MKEEMSVLCGAGAVWWWLEQNQTVWFSWALALRHNNNNNNRVLHHAMYECDLEHLPKGAICGESIE